MAFQNQGLTGNISAASPLSCFAIFNFSQASLDVPGRTSTKYPAFANALTLAARQ
jgi:hypothetical protein